MQLKENSARSEWGGLRIDEGPAKGLITSIAFFNGNTVTNLHIGAANTDQALIIKKIIDSIIVNN